MDLNAEGSLVMYCKTLVMGEVPMRLVLVQRELPFSLHLASMFA